MIRILVADDEADILESTQQVLVLCGFQVTGVAEAKSILATARRVRPDLLLQDVNMPGLDLDDLVHRLRAEPTLRALRILLFTASESIQETAQRLRVDGSIQKPFNADRIQQTIEGFMAKPTLGGAR